MHFTPSSGSWLNLLEIFFSIITRQAIRRGSFTSVKNLIAAIDTFIYGWNERPPFVWTKTADDILTQAPGGRRSSFTRHQVPSGSVTVSHASPLAPGSAASDVDRGLCRPPSRAPATALVSRPWTSYDR
jgi:hypothetical protein